MTYSGGFFVSNLPVSGQANFNRYMPPAVPGMMSGMGSCITFPWTNSIGSVDTWTLTPPTSPDNNGVYTVSLTNTTAIKGTTTITVSSSGSASDLMSGLYQQILQNPVFYSYVDASLNTTSNVITLSARSVGVTLNVFADPTGLTNVITAAKTNTTTSNAVIPFGRFVGRKSNYLLDPVEGVGSASLIDSTTGYQILGLTLSSAATEKVGLYDRAQDGYAYGTVMNVIKNTGTYKGVWSECVDSNIVIGQSAHIAVDTGNAGKVTNQTSSNVDASSFVKILSASVQSFDRLICLISIGL